MEQRTLGINLQTLRCGVGALTLLFLVGCVGSERRGMEVKLLFGSALEAFCQQSAECFNQTKPTLKSGDRFYVTCETMGSGDVVERVLGLAKQFQSGQISVEDSQFPTLVSVDGEIYHSQLIYQVDQLFPGQNYVPGITDAPLLVNSPMVFMVPANLAPGLRKVGDLNQALVTAQTHKDLDPGSPPQPIHYVHTAPNRSNSGLQTLVAQFASVSGKRPEELTLADVQRYQGDVQKIQKKITRYGVSTGALARDMVKFGPFWASVGSVYESEVIKANSNLQPGQTRYEAVYPKATFSSNMRAILATAPWVSAEEKDGGQQMIEFLRSPDIQKLATELGLRPGVSGVALGPKFSAETGVEIQPKYDSYRPPRPDVVDAMVQSWQVVVKKPSLVVVVVDSSGSMRGNKLPAVQSTLQTYIESLKPQDQLALIDFDSEIRPPVLVDGTSDGQQRGFQFVGGLEAEGGTRLYDSALAARDWLQQNLRPNAINAVLILTDGEDSGSTTNLDRLRQELEKSGFNSDQRIGFFTVGYGNQGDFNPDILKNIAEWNGGYYKEGKPETIAQLMADLQLEF